MIGFDVLLHVEKKFLKQIQSSEIKFIEKVNLIKHGLYGQEIPSLSTTLKSKTR